MGERRRVVPREVRTSLLMMGAVLIALGCGADLEAPGAGSLAITTTTSGAEPDTDGYLVAVDSGAPTAVGSNATLQRGGVEAGTHTVRLGGVADGCTVEGANPRTVEVVAETTVPVAFVITCAPGTGTIRVRVATSGSPVDPDGYVVQLDGGDPGLPVGTDGEVTFAAVAAGAHAIALTAVAPNCSVDGEASRSVTVTAGETADLSFAVTCAQPAASVHLTTTTTGSSVDPDGYLVSVDDGVSQVIGTNASLDLEGLGPGTHTLTLSGIAGNCHLDGANPRTVEVTAGSTNVAFDLTCLGADALIAFTSNAFGLLAVVVVNPDGSGLRNLTPDGEFESSPVWSPDGARLLFLRDGDLYVMNADGTGRISVADGLEISEHRWSPDGRMIAFVDVREEGGEFVNDLWVMQADGAGKVRVAEHAFNVSWSRDGRLAYTSVGDFSDVHLRIVHADGSSDARLTTRAAFQPAWSPDGARIAFVTLGEKDIYLINPDGSGEVNLTQGQSEDESPTWSPDGSRIAFTMGPIDQGLETEIAVMNRDGSSRATLTNHPGFDFEPAWSPDGARIVFTRSEDDGDSEIYVMNADGGSLANVTNRPDSRETTPDWNGRGAPVTFAGRQAAFYQRWLRANH